jgi:hypothetical protein
VERGCSWDKYEDFNAATGFSGRAGFTLAPLQTKLVEQLVHWPKNLNKLEVGCGKTVLSTVASLMIGYDCTVVTVPPILVDPWVSWLQQVSERVVDYRGDPRERKKINLEDARWVVCSHAMFRKDFLRLLQAAKERGRYELIGDEWHWAKNPESKLFQLGLLFTAGDVGHQMLTGTPLSKPLDAYSYIKSKSPQAYRSYGHFEAIHVAERDFWKAPIRYGNLDLLEQNLNEKSVTANKKEMFGYDLVMQMPDCSYSLDPDHYKLYEKLVDEQLLTFDDGSIIDASTVQKLRQALQQVVVNYDYFSNDPTKRSATMDLVDLTVEETECHMVGKSKLIIWAKYQRTITKLLKYCNDKGIKTVAAYGLSNANTAVAAFMADESCRILVGQWQSCGAGLNPQGVCSEALFVEMDTVPIYIRQALGRIDRKGQTVTPRTKIGVAKGTVQVGMLEALLSNDDMVQRLEPSKKSVRDMLLGRTDPTQLLKP